MMTPHVQDVIAKAERRGVTLFVRDGRLGASPMSAVTEELGAHIRAHKAELIAALASTPVAMDLPSEDRRQEPPSHCGRARRWKITTATGQVLLHSSPGGLTRQEAVELSKDWGEVAACVPVEEGALSSEESSYVGESRSDGSVCKDSGDRFMGISGAAEDILPGDGAPRMGQVNQEIQPGYSGALGDGGDRPDLKKKGRQDVPAELPNHGGRTLLTRTETRERHKEILACVKEGEPVYVYSHTLAEGVYWVRDEQTAEFLKRKPDYQGEAYYTLTELRELSGQSPDLLKAVHQFKGTFGATVQKTTKEGRA
jgi:TubC N-terminal docking domain